MADIRELALLDQMSAAHARSSFRVRVGARLKLATRRAVVATSVRPLRNLYAAIYRAHIRYALRILERFPRTVAVYLTRGMASGEFIYGVSDIDLVVIGDWSDEEHLRVLAAVRRLNRLSPLYDTTLQVHQLSVLQNLFETDYSVQFRFDQGRRTWKLLRGRDVLTALPPVPEERSAGGNYMEIRNWWYYFGSSAFGGGPLAVDPVFRSSICFKTVSEILRLGFGLESRLEAIRRAAASDTEADRSFFQRLLDSRERRFLSYQGDVVEDTFRYLLPGLEQFLAALAGTPLLQPVAEKVVIDGPAHEVLRTPAVQDRADQLLAHVKASWPGYRAAYLVPSLSTLNMDDLLLLIAVDTSELPTAAQVRELCRLLFGGPPPGQRLSPFLLLNHGAYQLDILSMNDLWRFVISPAAVPDVFAQTGGREFLLDGEPRVAVVPRWSRFAADLVDEELAVRVAAMSKLATPGSMPPSLVILRNVWRHLQLEVVQRSSRAGRPIIPLTLPAVQRGLTSLGIDAQPLDDLRRAYADELAGTPSDAGALVNRAMEFFLQLAGTRDAAPDTAPVCLACPPGS